MINNKETIAIIGAGPGTGYAVAERFGKEGFNVAIIARNTDKLKILASNLEKEDITAKYFTTDILDFKVLEKALQDTKTISVQ